MESSIIKEYNRKFAKMYIKILILEGILLFFLFFMAYMDTGGNIFQAEDNIGNVLLLITGFVVFMLLFSLTSKNIRVRRIKNTLDKLSNQQQEKLEEDYVNGYRLAIPPLPGNIWLTLPSMNWFYFLSNI